MGWIHNWFELTSTFTPTHICVSLFQTEFCFNRSGEFVGSLVNHYCPDDSFGCWVSGQYYISSHINSLKVPSIDWCVKFKCLWVLDFSSPAVDSSPSAPLLADPPLEDPQNTVETPKTRKFKFKSLFRKLRPIAAMVLMLDGNSGIVRTAHV